MSCSQLSKIDLFSFFSESDKIKRTLKIISKLDKTNKPIYLEKIDTKGSSTCSTVSREINSIVKAEGV